MTCLKADEKRPVSVLKFYAIHHPLNTRPILPPHRERHGRNVQGKGNAERLYSAYNQTDNPCAKNGAQLQCKQALLGGQVSLTWDAIRR